MANPGEGPKGEAPEMTVERESPERLLGFINLWVQTRLMLQKAAEQHNFEQVQAQLDEIDTKIAPVKDAFKLITDPDTLELFADHSDEDPYRRFREFVKKNDIRFGFDQKLLDEVLSE